MSNSENCVWLCVEIQLKLHKVNKLLSLLWDNLHSHHWIATEFQLNKNIEGEVCRVSEAQTTVWEKIKVRRELQGSESVQWFKQQVIVPLLILKRKKTYTGQLQQCVFMGSFPFRVHLAHFLCFILKTSDCACCREIQFWCTCEIIPDISALPGKCFFPLHCGTLPLCISCPPFLTVIL